ncbi:hypothetical protein ACFM35_15470 [Microbacterium sp. P01]|uniref:hypothetical protein n=1 Tax=Microbacterium sp. P01 TaxID=3366261 RepID=UPI00366D3506
MTWIWTLLLALLGQALCIASIVAYCRAHPNAKYPAWLSPVGQTERGRQLYGAGTFLTTAGALMTAYISGSGLGGAFIVVSCWIPVIVMIIGSNIAAARRRARQPET